MAKTHAKVLIPDNDWVHPAFANEKPKPEKPLTKEEKRRAAIKRTRELLAMGDKELKGRARPKVR
jgi:hypothetical protein